MSEEAPALSMGSEIGPPSSLVVEPLQMLHHVESSELRHQSPVAASPETVEVRLEIELGELGEADRFRLERLECGGEAAEVQVRWLRTYVDVLGRARVAVRGNRKSADDDVFDLVIGKDTEQELGFEATNQSSAPAASSVAISLSFAAWARRSSGLSSRKSARTSPRDWLLPPGTGAPMLIEESMTDSPIASISRFRVSRLGETTSRSIRLTAGCRMPARLASSA